MNPLIIIIISSLLFKSYIHPVQCTSLFDSISLKLSSSLSSSPSSSPQKQPSLSSSSSLRTTLIPSSPSHSPTSPDDHLRLLSPDSTPLFNPFNLDRQNQQQQSGAVDPEVKKTCDATNNPDLCISALMPFVMQNQDKKDILSLVEMHIMATQQAIQLALELTKKISMAPNTMKPIKDCKYVYNDAIDSLQEALNGLTSKDFRTVNNMLSDAVSDFSACDDELEGGEKTSPMVDYGDTLSKMISNCLAMVSLIND